MPGRGQPWKLGKGVADRIGTLAIADGSITEADLDSSLTSKVNQGGHIIQEEGTPLAQRPNMSFVGAGVVASDNGEDTIITIPGGGGAWTKLGDFTVSTAQTTMPVTFSAKQRGTYAQLLIVADFRTALTGATIDLTLEPFSLVGTFTTHTVLINGGTGAITGKNNGIADKIGTGETFTTAFSSVRISVQSNPSGEYVGYIDELAQFATQISRRGSWDVDTNTTTDVTGVTLTASQNFNIGSKISVYEQAL